jgi:hypothetical protein
MRLNHEAGVKRQGFMKCSGDLLYDQRRMEQGGGLMSAAFTAERPTIPVWRTATAAYRLGFGAVFGDFAMFRYFVYASVLALAVAAGQFYLANQNMRIVVQPAAAPVGNLTPLLQLGAELLLYILLAFVIAPFGVAVQRKILLRESPTGFYFGGATAPSQRRYFLATTFVFASYQLITLVSVPLLYFLYGVNALDTADSAAAYRSNHSIATAALLVTYALFFVAAIVAARCSLLFPAAAIDRPEAWFLDAMRAARGATARLFGVFILVCMPAVVAFFLGVIIAALVFVVPRLLAGMTPAQVRGVMLGSSPFLVLYACMFVIAMLLSAVIAAAAARAYEVRVNHDMGRVADVFS